MKKIIYYLIPCVCSLLIIGCTKEDQAIENSEEATLQHILELTNTFLKTQDKITTSAKAIDPAIAKIDITAFLDSYGGPNSSDDDLNDAYADGIAASYKAAEGVAPPNPGGNVDNTANAYDYVGKYHVDILDYQIRNKSNYVSPNNVFKYNRSIGVTSDYLAQDQIQLNMTNMMSNNQFDMWYLHLQQQLQTANGLISQTILAMEAAGKISTLESNILYHYFDAQENASSLTNFIQYSIQIEDIIINSSYNHPTKRFLLSAMATARHDFNYWQ
ncbi:hypothetical protein [uncultured Kordia sp.]|uniref:hypothetical protein n=1 Tax=uncultured Kordia sp. TaxID=507699 RepID=UPI002636AD39|nr:hypothetical protein [uncultured Kordia sp.]